jgi:8-oxo-dGTP diphosphatase
VEPVRVVAAIIERDGKYLGCRRAPGKSLAGMWEFPGGKVEPGETDQHALVREIHEELDVSIAVKEFVAESIQDAAGTAIHLLGYRCSLAHAVPSASTDHDVLFWFKPEEVNFETWAPADVPLLVGIQKPNEQQRSH